MPVIAYSAEERPDGATIARLYRAAQLRRPVDDPDRIARTYVGSPLVISAWDGPRLVGILRGWTDGAYDGYVCDLAVDPEYQAQGIGRELLRQCVSGSPDVQWVLQGVAHSPRGPRARRMGANRERMGTGRERIRAGTHLCRVRFRVPGCGFQVGFLVPCSFQVPRGSTVPGSLVPSSRFVAGSIGATAISRNLALWNREPVNKEAGTNPEPGTQLNRNPEPWLMFDRDGDRRQHANGHGGS